MRDALALVKREFGPHAVILGTRTIQPGALGGLVGTARVEITAAPERGSDEATKRPNDEGKQRRSNAVTNGTNAAGSEAVANIPPALYPHYVHLVQNEVAAELAAELVRRAAALPAPNGDIGAALRAAVAGFVAQHTPRVDAEGTPEGRPRRIALVGPPGSGKTTTLAKLAAHYRTRAGRKVALLSLDMHRAGGPEQLRRYAEVLDVPLRSAQTIDEVRQALDALSDADLLLIDTPGIGFRDQGRFARTAALLRAARPDETHLVLPASLTPEVQERTARAFAPLSTTRIILTRLDETIGFGVVLNVMQRFNIALSHVTTGQNVPNDLEIACETRLAELVCPPSG